MNNKSLLIDFLKSVRTLKSQTQIITSLKLSKEEAAIIDTSLKELKDELAKHI